MRGRIKGTIDYQRLADCDLVIEAITEDLERKLEMWKVVDEMLEVRGVLRDQYLLATGHRAGGRHGRPEQLPRAALLQSRPR